MPSLRSAALVNWVETVLIAVETPTDNARSVARSLVSSDLRGHSLHGVRLLPMYLDRIGSDAPNRINPTARPQVERRDGPRVLLDENDAFDRVVGEEATELAIELTWEYGLAVVGIRDGNHLGRIGE